MKVIQVSTLASAALLAASVAPHAHAQTTEDIRLTASDAAAFARYGYSTAVHGNRVVVGARGGGAGSSTESGGAAYVVDAVTGQELMKLESLDIGIGDIFGNTVALNDNVILVGADREDGDDVPGTFLTNSGSAYVFDAATGQQLFKLRANDALAHAHFAESVSLSGNLGVLGSNAINGQGLESGSVYVFDVTTGVQLHKLFASDGGDEDRLGESVSISGELLAAGAWADDDNGDNSGSAYVFNAVTGAEVAKLLPTDGTADDRFGRSVAISGDRVVVGADSDDDNGSRSGSAYVFDATTGQQLFKLLPSDGAANDTFGTQVAVDGSLVLVSARQDDDGASSSGSVYVFDLATGQQLAKLTASDASTNHFFGTGLSIHGDTIAIGSPFTDHAGTTTGTAYLFSVDNDPGGVTSFCEPTTANSVSPTGALLTSAGGFGTAQATFHLMDVPDSFGILFAGNMATDVALGCGRLCAGGSIIRGAVIMPSGNQLLDVPFDMSQAGATHIQYWFRDSGTCGSGTNLSNALTR